MHTRTNPTARASKCRDLASQITQEARAWTNPRAHRKLVGASLQLAYLAKVADKIDAESVEAYITVAEELLARAMTARAFGEAL